MSLPSGTPTSGPQERITLGTPSVVPGHTGTCTSPSPPAYFALLTQFVTLREVLRAGGISKGVCAPLQLSTCSWMQPSLPEGPFFSAASHPQETADP